MPDPGGNHAHVDAGAGELGGREVAEIVEANGVEPETVLHTREEGGGAAGTERLGPVNVRGEAEGAV
jgi:hypothetical protein